MSKPLHRVRMSDVAREAGVARVTVSRVISAPDSVAPKTRAAVEAAIARLGFIPNLNAGTLASRRSHIVAALVPTLSNAWFADTMDGLAGTLSAAGYQLMLGQTRYDPEEEEKLVNAFIGRRVDAIVLTGTSHPDGLRRKLRQSGIPIAECWDLSDDPIDFVVGFSNTAAGETVARHLVSRGCRRFGFIGADEDRTRKRLQGFRAAARSAGLDDVRVQTVHPPSGIDDGRLALEALVRIQPDIDGVFCSNDTLALGVLQACRNNGWSVPGRIAVAGFSDLPVAAASVPALTTVRVYSRSLGERIGDLLVQRLRHGKADAQRIHDMGFSLIVRESA